MRIIKAILSTLVFVVVAPVVITATLGFALAPCQMTADAHEPDVVFQASDIMLPDVA